MSMRESKSRQRRVSTGAIAEVVQRLQQIVQGLDRFSRATLHRYGVTGPQLWALRCLAIAGEMSTGQLTRQMYLHPSTVTGVLDRLQAQGMIRRRRATVDRRQVLLRITPRGAAALARAPEPPRARLVRELQTCDELEVERMGRLLRTLVRMMRLAKTPR